MRHYIKGEQFTKGFKKNLSWIFLGNLLHAVLQYAINIVCARAFGTNDYGVINYTSSLIAVFTAIGTLGFDGIITKKFAENEQLAGEYLGTAIFARLIYSVVAIILLQVFIFYTNRSDSGIQLIVFCQSLQIMFGTADLLIYWLRFKCEAKTAAILRLVAFSISAVWRIGAILILHNVPLYVLGVVLETGAFSLLLIWVYTKKYKSRKFSINYARFTEMLRISYPFICSSILSTIYAQTDKMMLKNMVDNSAVALYSVSQTLAGAIVIIPTSLIEGFRPDIMTFRTQNLIKYRQRLQQLYGLVFWICVAYCLFITLFAGPIIHMLYGQDYMGAVPSLSLIVWYTSFSYFGAINNIYMVSENKTVWVQITTFTGATLNVILNAILIPQYGVVGAAGASLVTQVVANFFMLLAIKPLREAFHIVVEGIALKGFITTKNEKA